MRVGVDLIGLLVLAGGRCLGETDDEARMNVEWPSFLEAKDVPIQVPFQAPAHSQVSW